MNPKVNALEKKYFTESDFQTQTLGAAFADACPSNCTLYLYGELGCGKTTFVRGFLQQFGVKTKIRSPTYTIVEPYTLNKLTVYHFDLYRINDSAELEYLGIRDYLNTNYIFIIEWPALGIGVLPDPDLVITIIYGESGRTIEVRSHSEMGNNVLLNVDHI